VQFCGRRFSASEVSMICEVVETCGGIGRKELARTVCELLDFARKEGGREC
jgi:predicted HAD superfamily phosphohydrolase